MTLGMLCGLAGLLILAQITKTSGYALVLPGFLLFGIALGFVYAPMSNAAMAAMPREKSGIASGVLAMNRVLAGAVALAVTGAVFQDLLPAHGFPISLARSTWWCSSDWSPRAPCSRRCSCDRRPRSLATRGFPRPRTPRRSPITSTTAASTYDACGIVRS